MKRCSIEFVDAFIEINMSSPNEVSFHGNSFFLKYKL